MIKLVIKKSLKITILLIGLPVAVVLIGRATRLLPLASVAPANIVVEAGTDLGPLELVWQSLAQGGEEKDAFDAVIALVTALKPTYIRIDHLYDFYHAVAKNGDQLTFTWAELDKVVDQILQMGAKPFITLSYMPPVIAKNGDITAEPENWQDWQTVVQRTVAHFSGRQARNINGVIYEVWNEPDLETFGKWKYLGGKSYSELYSYSVKGAAASKNVFSYKLGGPVTTALYKNWIQKFLDYVAVNNLKLDFISWHHYSKKTDDYTDDIIKLNKWLGESPRYDRFEKLPRIISEWGYDSEKNPIADTEVGAAHTLASIRNFINANLEAAFLFEIKDGPFLSWGILNHDASKKPRWYALQMLNSLGGNQIIIDGEGTYVTALSSKNDDRISLILTNYDGSGRNTEAVPVVFKNLAPGKYNLTKIYIDGRKETILNLRPINGEISLKGDKSIIMPANSIVAIELTSL